MEAALNKASNADGGLLRVEIISPSYKSKLEYQGLAQSVTSTNSEGTFDVLPMHENFVTLLTGPVIVVDERGSRREFKVGTAVLEASGNVVRIFVEF